MLLVMHMCTPSVWFQGVLGFLNPTALCSELNQEAFLS